VDLKRDRREERKTAERLRDFFRKFAQKKMLKLDEEIRERVMQKMT